VFNRDGLVWIGRRYDANAAGEGPGAWWQMPQGGLDDDEEPERAVTRELDEETSMTSVTLLRAAPGWLNYDLPPELVPKSWGGKYRGQTQKWFALRFTGSDSEIDVAHPGGGKHKPEFSAWRWEKLERVPDLVVAFKRDVYRQVVAAFGDLAAP
jgi:putative (di)nucleoside polyphosphate hydrolase